MSEQIVKRGRPKGETEKLTSEEKMIRNLEKYQKRQGIVKGIDSANLEIQDSHRGRPKSQETIEAEERKRRYFTKFQNEDGTFDFWVYNKDIHWGGPFITYAYLSDKEVKELEEVGEELFNIQYVPSFFKERKEKQLKIVKVKDPNREFIKTGKRGRPALLNKPVKIKTQVGRGRPKKIN